MIWEQFRFVRWWLTGEDWVLRCFLSLRSRAHLTSTCFSLYSILLRVKYDEGGTRGGQRNAVCIDSRKAVASNIFLRGAKRRVMGGGWKVSWCLICRTMDPVCTTGCCKNSISKGCDNWSTCGTYHVRSREITCCHCAMIIANTMILSFFVLNELFE